MNELSWARTKDAVTTRGKHACEYCGTHERSQGFSLHIDHIVPGGGSELNNLALACQRCNQSKFTATTAVDPVTGTVQRLFNPRADSWSDHFAWSEGYTIVIGVSEIGRATVSRLRMNDERTVDGRRFWRIGGNHPPQGFPTNEYLSK